jgi:4-hydroxy-tetrahydrodipicolinate reductase
MIRIAVNGALGRMGKRIVALASQDKELEIKCAIEKPLHPGMGGDVGQAAGLGTINVPVKSGLTEKIDVLIDFSSPDATRKRLREALDFKCGMVIGTTGLSDEDMQAIQKASESIAIVQAPNMSVGVNLIFSLAGTLAKTLGEEYDIEIVETHHRHKKDAPSGTALKIAEIIADAVGTELSKAAVYGRQGAVGERKKGEIGIHAKRSGDIVGVHTISFGAMGEEIELTHRATSRDTFALGALRAAKFAASKDAGLYSMQDVLGL